MQHGEPRPTNHKGKACYEAVPVYVDISVQSDNSQEHAFYLIGSNWYRPKICTGIWTLGDCSYGHNSK